jgi:hypothetical protein
MLERLDRHLTFAHVLETLAAMDRLVTYPAQINQIRQPLLAYSFIGCMMHIDRFLAPTAFTPPA